MYFYYYIMGRHSQSHAGYDGERIPEQRDLATRIEEIMGRPDFQNARWGMKFYDPTANQILYSINSDQLFHPASSMKVFVEGTAFDALGIDYLFRTRVYRTGPVVWGGVLPVRSTPALTNNLR